MRIQDIKAIPVSFRITDGVKLGIGTAIKRDAVVVKVTTDEGIVGWGESHNGRCPGAIAYIVNTVLRDMVVGMDAGDTVGVWDRIYNRQLRQGMGASCAMAMSGIDIALWDIRGKAAGLPVYKLLGGTSRAIPAYAGGIALGYQAPESLVEEARALIEAGYRAIKLRVGESPALDLARVAAVRRTFGEALTIMVDANTQYSLPEARDVIPGLDDNRVRWLEEPFAPHDFRSYATARTYGSVPFAAGENHYTRFEFHRLIEDEVIGIMQPDVSKSGGITEALRISCLASAWKLPINPHTSTTALNMAATIHLLASIDNAGFFETDASKNNPFRDKLANLPYKVAADGCVRPLDGPGLGLEIDEKFLAAHPLIEGSSFG
jgi:D-galactarolactone cycloisomerase